MKIRENYCAVIGQSIDRLIPNFCRLLDPVLVRAVLQKKLDKVDWTHVVLVAIVLKTDINMKLVRNI